MPVYLCQSGKHTSEPWRHGRPVYAMPVRDEAPPLRRIRHAEVVLVDDVCVAFDRYWLRLRWPGSKGGFAGYLAMGLVAEEKNKALVRGE